MSIAQFDPLQLNPATHISNFFVDQTAFRQVTVACIERALQKNQTVVYLFASSVSQKNAASLLDVLRPGKDKSGLIHQMKFEDLLKKTGTATPEMWTEWLRDVFEEKRDVRGNNIFFILETGRILKDNFTLTESIQAISNLNRFAKGHFCNILSQYHYNDLDPELLQLVLSLSNQVIYNNRVYRNVCALPVEQHMSVDLKSTLLNSWIARQEDMDIGRKAASENDSTGVLRREFAFIIDSIPLMVSYLDKDDIFLFVNKTFSNWHGLNRKQIIGRHLREIAGEEAFQRARPGIRKVIKGERVSFENVEQNKFNQNRVLQVNLEPGITIAGQVRTYISVMKDITEEKKAQVELLVSEYQYRGIVEIQTELICRYLPDGLITFVNEAYCRYFNCEKDDLIGKHLSLPVVRRFWQNVLSAREKITEENPIVASEIMLKMPSGEERWLEWTEQGIYYDNELVEYQAVGDDITRSKKAEEALRQSEERLRLVLSNIPLILIAVNKKGTITLAEGRGLEKAGLEPQRMVGNPVESFLEDLPEMTKMAQDALQGASGRSEIAFLNTVFDIWWEPLRAMDGEIRGALGVAMDITEQQEAREELRLSEERYRSLVENQGEGAAIVDRYMRFEYMNLAAAGILGLPASELIGRRVGDFLAEDEKQDLQKQYSRIRQGYVAVYETRLVRQDDDSQRQVLVTATPRYDSEGKFSGSFIIFRDITERKHQEDRLQYISTHDTLTGLYNRYYFEEEMSRLDGSRRKPVSFIVADVDKLKEINDSLGHLAGDKLLQTVAQILKRSFRAEDMVARIGGDEFAILLPGTDEAELERTMKRLESHL